MADPTGKNLLRRLAWMSSRELAHRLRQFVTARVDVLRYRKLGAFTDPLTSDSGKTGRFYFSADEIPDLLAQLRRRFPSSTEEIVMRAEKICKHRFDLLGFTDLDYGPEIDWHCDVVHGKRAPLKPWFQMKYLDFAEVGDSKVTWELNRHQHFITLCKAYWLTGDEKYVEELLSQWHHWLKQNPYPIGLNWASSLEVAFRSLSWIWSFFFLQGCPLFTPDLENEWIGALSRNGRHIENYLSTYFSPNTHLLGEALALFSIGTLFPSIRRAARWQRRGWEILQHEATRQVRPDGFYFEQSTYYHVYAVDMLIHARILARINGLLIAPHFDELLQGMLNALMLLSRAGLPPSLGDDDGGRLFDPRRNCADHMLDPLATGAVLYSRGDFKYLAPAPREETLWLLGKNGLTAFDALTSVPPPEDATALLDAGIYLIPDRKSQFMIDAGPLGAGGGGHGHADALSIILVENGRSVLVDSGTCEYVGSSEARVRFRGTSAHNTMQVDASDQSDPTGPFSWGNQAQVNVERWVRGRHFTLFRGRHDGYARASSPVIHRRSVFHRKGAFWFVRDVAEGKGAHQLDIAWHVSPAMHPPRSGQLVFEDDGTQLGLLPSDNHGWSQSVRRDAVSPVYGHREHGSLVTFRTSTELPQEFATIVMSGRSLPADLGRLVRIRGVAGRVSSYRYCTSQDEHGFFFSDLMGAWSQGVWSSDAEFLYFSFDRGLDEYLLVLCNGSYADADGIRVLGCEGRVGYAEAITRSGNAQVFSSEPEKIKLQQSMQGLRTDPDLTVSVRSPDRTNV